MPLSLLIERPFALASSAIRRLSIGAVFIMATFSDFGSVLAQTDEIYTRGEDRRDAQYNGDEPFCGPEAWHLSRQDTTARRTSIPQEIGVRAS